MIIEGFLAAGNVEGRQSMQDPLKRPAQLSITQSSSTGMRVLKLCGEIDADTADGLREALSVDDSVPRSVLDLSIVTFMDSSAISVLVAARRDATAAGGWIRMAALTEPVQRVVEVVGLDTIISCYPTLPQALAA
ncbi:STAS domain-containing protein [Streptomyces sp. NPDC055109]